MNKAPFETFGEVRSVREEKRINEDGNDVLIGIVEGYLATWDVDRASDRFVMGAFKECIEDLQRRGRPMRLKRNHFGALIGGFDPKLLREDDIGLYGVGEINLMVEEGREAYALAKQGVLSDFSVGFSAEMEDIDVTDGIRTFRRAKVWETSLVDEPMNPKAVVTGIRGAIAVSKLPSRMAERSRAWDSGAAIARVRTATGSTDEPSESYRNAFLWYDEAEPQNFASYKLPVVDVINDELTVIPRAVFAVRAALEGARGGVDLPDEDRGAVERTVNALYERMDMDPPFTEGSKGMWCPTEITGLANADRRYIIGNGRLSSNAVKMLSELAGSVEENDSEESSVDELIDELRTTRETEELKALLQGAWNARS